MPGASAASQNCLDRSLARAAPNQSSDREGAVKESVLILGNFLSGTGASRGVCEDLSHRLAAGGWSVVWASDRRSRPARLTHMLRTAWVRRRDYRVAQVDVYAGLSFIWAELACLLLRAAGKPYVLTLHGGSLPSFAGSNPRRVRRLLESAAAVTSPSRYLQVRMQPFRRDIRLLPNGLDLTAYRFALRSRPRPRLVWLRAFHEVYNPSLAVRVLALLRKEFPEATLVMAGADKGDGSLQRAERLAEELGAGEHAIFSGNIPKDAVPEFLQQGDLFLNTTDVDNAPVSVIEAMACGLCVVSTNAGGLPYLLEGGANALLVPCGDAPSMAAAVRQILTEPALAARLSASARSAAEPFDWSLVIPRWQSLLTGLGTAGREG